MDGGVVAACVWDFTDGGPLGPFWDAAHELADLVGEIERFLVSLETG
jgi:hypothetical protein